MQAMQMNAGRVIVFGAGAGGRHAARALGRGQVLCLVDNDPGKWRTRVSGIAVAGPSAIDLEGAEPILIASVFAADIYEQLLGMGIRADRIRIASAEMMTGALLPSPRCAALLVALALLLTLAVI